MKDEIVVDFQLTPEQRQIRDTLADFAEREIKPHAAAWDRDATFPRHVVAQLGELGFLANLTRRLAIVALSANNWPILKDYVPRIHDAIDAAVPGSVRMVECGVFSRKR